MAKKRIVKRGKRVSADELAYVLGGPCGARAMDDDEDVEATVRELRKRFLIYEKHTVRALTLV